MKKQVNKLGTRKTGSYKKEQDVVLNSTNTRPELVKTRKRNTKQAVTPPDDELVLTLPNTSPQLVKAGKPRKTKTTTPTPVHTVPTTAQVFADLVVKVIWMCLLWQLAQRLLEPHLASDIRAGGIGMWMCLLCYANNGSKDLLKQLIDQLKNLMEKFKT